ALPIFGQQLARFSGSEAVQSIIASEVGKPNVPSSTKSLVLNSMAASGLKQVPKSWTEAVRAALSDADQAVARAAIGAARALAQAKNNPPNFSESLAQLGSDSSKPTEVRLEARAAAPAEAPSADSDR